MFQRIVSSLRRRLRIRYFEADERLKRKVVARKRAIASSPIRHTDRPNLSLIIQSFNHRRNIPGIVTRLRATAAEEIIVCEDGSVDGSEREWLRHLTRPNDFLIRSNDIHEIRSYNRAVDMARGRIVCVMQDDDIPPPNGDWVANSLAIFDRHPKLAILGSWFALAFNFDRTTGDPFDHVPVSTREPDVNVPFMFAQTVGIGPVFFRRDTFQALGGFDLSFSQPGEPGIVLDQDICFRAWLAGYQVGLYPAAGFKRRVGGQGTEMFGPVERKKNRRANLDRVKERYAGDVSHINAIVAELNRGLVPGK
jgi:GT2 family glycosyltransferase